MMIKSLAWICFLFRGVGRLFVKDNDVNRLRNGQISVNASSAEQNVSSPKKEALLHPCCQRLQHLEKVVADLLKKPTNIPPEKEHMLLDSMDRIKFIEYDLQRTKKVMVHALFPDTVHFVQLYSYLIIINKVKQIFLF